MQNKHKKILLIGSCGFLLSNFLRKTLYNKENNYSIIGIDDLSKNHSYYNRYFHHGYNFYLSDVTDIFILQNIFKIEKPDIVIFGADSNDSEGKAKNIGISNLLNIVLKKYGCEKFIYLSTSAVYGEKGEFSELDSENSLYLQDYQSDLAAEEMIKSSSFINWNILRISDVYGQRSGTDSLIPKCLNSYFYNKEIYLFNHGLNERDYLYIDDFCSALAMIINKGDNNEIYNVSSGFSISELEIVHEICNIVNGNFNLVKFYKEEFSESYQISSEKLQKLGWKPNLKWRDHIKENIEWLLNNKWFFNLYDKTI